MIIRHLIIIIVALFLSATFKSNCLAQSAEPVDSQGCDIQAAQQALDAVCKSCPSFVAGYTFETKRMGECDPSARTLLTDEENNTCQEESLTALRSIDCPDETINLFDCCASPIQERSKVPGHE